MGQEVQHGGVHKFNRFLRKVVRIESTMRRLIPVLFPYSPRLFFRAFKTHKGGQVNQSFRVSLGRGGIRDKRANTRENVNETSK